MHRRVGQPFPPAEDFRASLAQRQAAERNAVATCRTSG